MCLIIGPALLPKDETSESDANKIFHFPVFLKDNFLVMIITEVSCMDIVSLYYTKEQQGKKCT